MSTLLGRQVLVELYDCDPILLDDESSLCELAVGAARDMGAAVMGVHSHRYEPHGVSVVLILAESHLSLHTWPELDAASVDVYVCGTKTDPHRAKDYLAERLGASRFAELEVERGAESEGRPLGWSHVELSGRPKA